MDVHLKSKVRLKDPPGTDKQAGDQDYPNDGLTFEQHKKPPSNGISAHCANPNVTEERVVVIG